MIPQSFRARRLLIRLAVLFVVGQVVAVAGALFALPAMQTMSAGPVLVILLVLVDLGLVVVVASWIIRASVSDPMGRLSTDVLRIADGDYHHRVGDPHRVELRVIRESVNRLADRLIADQQLLADNVQSLERTNRELVVARDQVIRSARLASVGTLAAGIAHEVGNPLGAIIGFVDVARGRVAKEGGDTELLDSIRSEAARIDRIIRGILDYARPKEGGGEPAPASEVVDRVRQLLHSQGRLDDVQHEWLIGDAGDHVIGEPHRLEQVLVNLLLNAIHASKDVQDPRIVVRVEEGEGEVLRMPSRREDDPPGINYMHRRRAASEDSGVDAVATSERLTVIAVSDNGHGVTEEMVENLFDPFYTTKEPGEGTGLGLSICAQLVEGMGGRIDVEDGIDGGASFVIRLPAPYDKDEAETGPTDSSEESSAP